MTVVILPATEERWPDIGPVYGPRERDPDSCWCQRFREPSRGSARDALHHEVVTAGVPVGLIAYVDERPVGWSRVVPRNTLAGIERNRAIQRIVEPDDAAWWVTCFVVRREHRGEGIGLQLLRAAADWARDHGASVLDGHPVDVDVLQSAPAASAVFTGTLSMFRAAGFTEIGRTYPSRPLMRLTFE